MQITGVLRATIIRILLGTKLTRLLVRQHAPQCNFGNPIPYTLVKLIQYEVNVKSPESGVSDKQKYEQIFLGRLPFSGFLAKSPGINKIASKSFPKPVSPKPHMDKINTHHSISGMRS